MVRKLHVLEEGSEDYMGRDKKRERRRTSTDEKYRRVESLLGEGETTESPPARVLHIGNRLPQGTGPEKIVQGDKDKSEELPKEKKHMYRTGPTPETAKRKPSHEISPEERITVFEDEIASDFREDERRYIRQWVDIYPAEFQKAIEKREKNGRKVTEKELPAIRLSFINNIAKWGSGIGMALEKENLLEKYLDLKLPAGIPVDTEKNSGNNKNPMEKITLNNRGSEDVIKEGQERKTEFSPEQIKELDDFFAVIKEEYGERFLKGNFRKRTFLWEVQAAFRVIFREDYVREGMFSEADEEAALKIITEKVNEDIIKI